MKITAKVMNINFYNSKNNYYILKINIKKNSNKQIILKNTTLKGNTNVQISKGDIIDFEASYNKSENNLILEKMETKEITENERLANFFVEHTEKISKDTFLKILNTYSLNDIIKDESLLNNFKLSQKKKDTIFEAFKEYKKIEYISNIMSLMGADKEQALAAYENFGIMTKEIIEKNPYKLYFYGILEWKEVERLARFYSVKDEIRNEAITLKQIYDSCYNSGNTCILESDIEKTDTLEKLIQDDKLVRYRDCIYTKRLYKAERTLEKRIREIADLSKKNDGVVSCSQEEAVQNALDYHISILTGGPGTGKTYTVNRIVKELENRNHTYCLLAPTGKAADRLTELTNRPTETIHRKLKLLPYSNYKTEEEITEDYILIDECSMLDLELSACLFTHISDTTKIVLIGDVNQLPSVSCGRVFQDLIESGLIKTTKLEKVYRQAGDSHIIKNAYALLNDEALDYTSTSDFEFIECEDVEEIQNYIKDRYNRDKTMILSPQHESQLGTDILNLIIQNKDEEGFYEYDKVIQNTNDYDLGVFNGNLGYISDIEERLINGEWQKVYSVNFSNINKIIEYNKKNINEIELAYSLTIHKSQGSEFDTVIIPTHNSLEYMLNKNLLYTAFTRAKKHLVLIGDKETLETTRHKGIQRISNLF